MRPLSARTRRSTDASFVFAAEQYPIGPSRRRATVAQHVRHPLCVEAKATAAEDVSDDASLLFGSGAPAADRPGSRGTLEASGDGVLYTEDQVSAIVAQVCGDLRAQCEAVVSRQRERHGHEVAALQREIQYLSACRGREVPTEAQTRRRAEAAASLHNVRELVGHALKTLDHMPVRPRPPAQPASDRPSRRTAASARSPPLSPRSAGRVTPGTKRRSPRHPRPSPRQSPRQSPTGRGATPVPDGPTVGSGRRGSIPVVAPPTVRRARRLSIVAARCDAAVQCDTRRSEDGELPPGIRDVAVAVDPRFLTRTVAVQTGDRLLPLPSLSQVAARAASVASVETIEVEESVVLESGSEGPKTPRSRRCRRVGVQTALGPETLQPLLAREATVYAAEDALPRLLSALDASAAQLVLMETKMLSDLTCRHCFDLFRDPVALSPCGHTFCTACVENHMRQRPAPDTAFFCPEKHQEPSLSHAEFCCATCGVEADALLHIEPLSAIIGRRDFKRVTVSEPQAIVAALRAELSAAAARTPMETVVETALWDSPRSSLLSPATSQRRPPSLHLSPKAASVMSAPSSMRSPGDMSASALVSPRGLLPL